MTDPYTNENGVLKNKLGIKKYEELNKAEADIGFIKLISIDSVELDKFDENLIKRIHKHIFEDIFDWAGEYRTVPIVKEELVLPGYSIPYSDYKDISKDLTTKLNELNSIPWQNLSTKEIASKFARKMALIWRVHPFRDGNTRTMLSFAYLYSKEHNFPFDMKTFTDGLSRKFENGKVVDYSIRDKFALACLDQKDYPEVEHLARVFENSINAYNPEEVKTLK
ncbi:MAG: Fic family protein [Bacilli bacterium]|nr:Fic family protein [Bacilli bacterium]MBO6194835.1 Fic family protein [Bacilli bacterium]